MDITASFWQIAKKKKKNAETFRMSLLRFRSMNQKEMMYVDKKSDTDSDETIPQ